MRLATALLVGLALAASLSVARAQKSAPAPGFEYLGTMQVQTGTRTVVENGPQGTRTIVQIVRAAAMSRYITALLKWIGPRLNHVSSLNSFCGWKSLFWALCQPVA